MTRQYRTGDQTWVRERNIAILLNYVWEAGGPVSRTDLTRMSGLNKSTVGSLLQDLRSWRLVQETGISNQRPGRPGILFDLNPDAGRIIGVELGVGFISVVMTDMKARVIWRRQVNHNSAGEPLETLSQSDVLTIAEGIVKEAANEARHSNCRLFGIGLGVPGLVNHATGNLIFAPNLGWRNAPIRDRFRRQFDTLVMIENDANASALGEQMLGVARQVDNFVYLSSGMGLGSGLVISGQLYEGAGGYAGEVGHMTMLPDGPLCNCGNRGCWETLVGPRAVLDRVRQAAQEGQAPGVLALSGQKADAIQLEHIVSAATQGDPAVLSALSEVGRYLGIGIANLLNALNPRMVVIGGYMSLVGPYILPQAQEEVKRRALAATNEGIEIKVSAFTFDACVIGCVALILRQILMNPIPWFRRQRTPAEEAPLSVLGGIL